MADLSPAAASIQLISGQRVSVTFGATITAGQVLYLDGSDNKAKLADADAAGKKTVYGIALDSGSDGDTGDVALSGSVINLAVTVGVGTPYFLSSNAGGICPLADVGTGEDVDFLGVGKTAGGQLAVHIFNSGIAHA